MYEIRKKCISVPGKIVKMKPADNVAVIDYVYNKDLDKTLEEDEVVEVINTPLLPDEDRPIKNEDEW